MNYLDAIIVLPLIWGAYSGFKKGLVYEIAMIIGLVLGLYLAFKFSVFFEGIVKKFISENSAALPYISFFLVFILVILIMVLLAKLLEGILKVTNLNAFNKIAGGVFGLLKFGLVISVILTLFRPIDEKLSVIKPEAKEKSLLFNPVANAAQYIFPALGDVQKVFRQKL